MSLRSPSGDASDRAMSARKAVPTNVQLQVLIEAGYRCGVPTCRTILALDLHHMVEVSEGGANTPDNLLALCPTCHALHHRGTIPREAIFAWKSILVSLTQAFDRETLDLLLFLTHPQSGEGLALDGAGVLRFARLIAAGLATFRLAIQNGPLFVYTVTLTPKGRLLVEGWRSGEQATVTQALASGAGDSAVPSPQA